MQLPPRSKIVMRTKVPVEAIKPWKSKHPEPHHYDILLRGNCEVRSPTGEPVVVVLRNVLSKEVVDTSKPILHQLRRGSRGHRQNHSGRRHQEQDQPSPQRRRQLCRGCEYGWWVL